MKESFNTMPKRKKNKKNHVYTKKHTYKVNDIVKFRWLDDIRVGKIVKTFMFTYNETMAAYVIMVNGDKTRYTPVGENDDLHTSNIIGKM